jgi:hypothetical protein
MVTRSHGRAAYLGPATHPTGPSGFTKLDVLMIYITELAYGCGACTEDAPKFAGRQLDENKFLFLTDQMG